MDSRAAIRNSIEIGDMIVQGYLGDLSDEELLVRPVEGANHIAWQLGHLISSQNQMVEGCRSGSMPALPDGFAEKYDKESSKSDDASAFDSKETYLALLKEQTEATLKTVDSLSDEQLDEPAPEKLRQHFPTVGVVLNMQGLHVLMHVGQWAVLRRKLGKPVLF